MLIKKTKVFDKMHILTRKDLLSQFCQPGRPSDFYSQKNCENQIRFILTQEGDLKTASKNFKSKFSCHKGGLSLDNTFMSPWMST